MAAAGVTLAFLAGSIDGPRYIQLLGFPAFTSANSVRDHILKYAAFRRGMLASELRRLCELGSTFAMCVDEWTSVANRRYMNVTLNCSKPLSTKSRMLNLGVAAISGPADSACLSRTLQSKLAEFGLTLRDVPSLTSDAASVLKAMCKRFTDADGRFAQLECMLHGLQLSILDVIADLVSFLLVFFGFLSWSCLAWE